MIKIYLQRHPHTLATDVFIVQENEKVRDGDMISYINFETDGTAIATQKQVVFGAVDNQKPSMTLQENDLRDLIEAFAQLATKEHITLPDESFVKGKLAGVEAHLADMRDLVFKK